MDDNKLSFFCLGLGLGVALGMLFAPKSGEETRELLLSKADEGKDFVLRSSETLRESAAGIVDRGKEALGQQKDKLSEAVAAGRQAYKDVVSEGQASTT
ncbi:MAG: YtxH domain-containing protein [Bryobacterales bacterium]|nr:YtxH domain-containing protein [Bryobacterales bacterium]